MSNFYEKIEEKIKSQQFVHIIPLIYYHGVTCKVALPSQDVNLDVYGAEYTGASENYTEEIKAIVSVDGYDTQYGGGVLYTLFPKELPIGSILKVERQDLANRRYSIHDFKRYGLTDKVFYRYILNSIGD